MKKNRPGVLLGILCQEIDIVRLEQIVFAETGSLGIRRWPAQRHILPRESRSVETPWGTVQGKIALLADGCRWFSPEFESCRQVAARNGRPRGIYRAAQQAFDLSRDSST